MARISAGQKNPRAYYPSRLFPFEHAQPRLGQGALDTAEPVMKAAFKPEQGDGDRTDQIPGAQLLDKAITKQYPGIRVEA